MKDRKITRLDDVRLGLSRRDDSEILLWETIAILEEAYSKIYSAYMIARVLYYYLEIKDDSELQFSYTHLKELLEEFDKLIKKEPENEIG